MRKLFTRFEMPSQRDYAGTACINLQIAIETTDLEDRHVRLSIAIDDLASAGEPTWAALARDVDLGRAYVSLLVPVVVKLKEKYSLQ